jgi:PAS domain S-box-containing protein
MSTEPLGERNPVNILLVDDQPGKLLSYEVMLGGLGENLIRAGSGKEALEQLLKHDVAVILMDVCMPELDGFELATLIHHHPRFSKTAIIHVSAVNLSDFDRVKGYDSGAVDYVSVPVSPEVLRAKVKVFADLYRKTREIERLNRITALQLDQSEERFRFLAETIPSFVWTADHDGRLLWANQRLLDYCGLKPEQLPSARFEGVLHSDDSERLSAVWNDARNQGRDFEIEVRKRREDGADRWFLLRAVPQKDGQRVLRWFGVSTDIHEQKLLAERLREADRRKDDFMAMLSHELRAPLTPILGWTSVLRRGRLDARQTDHALAVIERNVMLQAQLIRDLLDVSHIVGGTLRMDLGRLDLGAVVDAALETVRPAAEAKGVTLERAGPDEALPVTGDGARLQQVVWNLVSNGIKFTPAGGRVEVTLGRQGESARLRVRDNGIGIDAGFLPHVFERFRQAAGGIARSHGGLGLGLTIVRHLVEAHGGRVEAESAGHGAGACFSVELPLAPPDEASARAASAAPAIAAEGPKLSGVKVLVVDDESDTREMLRMVLSLEGAHVRVAGSVREALAAFSEERPDLVVSDIGMPAEDGYALLAKLRALPREVGGGVPAVALTALAAAADAERSRAAGYELHLTKPIEPQSVVAALASVVARRAADSAGSRPPPASPS